MVDAAGAIYVIGGRGWSSAGDSVSFNDVWVSTDGGARPDLVRGGTLGGYGGGTQGVLRGSLGYPRGLHQADPPTHAFRTIARVAFPRSQDM